MAEEKIQDVVAGKSRISFSKNNLIVATIIGDFDAEMASICSEAIFKYLEKTDDKIDLLIDFNKVGLPSTEARSIGIDLFEHEKIRKIAMIGIHPVAKVVAGFVMGFSKSKKLRFLKTKDDAMRWFKE